MSTICVLLKKEREKQGVSQEKLACAIGVTKQMVSLYETGKSAPSVDTIDKAFKFLGVSVTIGKERGDE